MRLHPNVTEVQYSFHDVVLHLDRRGTRSSHPHFW